ncbi:MAG: leucine-rich repeat domain-containing protein [Lachnospiraceae bacterium]|nr:leucine-rich repeat domain-containing protein [Lachnospiraceae bacterium]
MKKSSLFILMGAMVVSNICSFNVMADTNTNANNILSISQSVDIENSVSDQDIYNRIDTVENGNELEFDTIFHKKIVKNDISYTFNNGVLTVAGTGIVDDSYTKNYNKDSIKEVVISKGIIGIADYAFMGCKNIKKITLPDGLEQIGCYAFADAALKELTIPATVTKIGYMPFEKISKDAVVTMPATGLEAKCVEHYDVLSDAIFNRVKEINLNTNYTPDKKFIFASEKLNVLGSDPNYSSFDGVVYSKDGKKLIQVPRYKDTLNIRKGCTTVSLQAIVYLYDSNNDGAWKNYCVKFKSITIPSTVNKVINDVEHANSDYFNILYDDDCEDTSLAKCKWTIKSKKLDGKSILSILRIANKKTYKSIIKDKKFKIKKVGNMYISKDGVLLRYTGKEASVTIPAKVKVIGDAAFSDNNNLKVVKFAKNSKIKEIGAYAFSYKSIKSITIPKGCKVIGNGAFSNSSLTTINLPNTITTIGDYAFFKTPIKKIKMPKNLKTIGDSAFAGCEKLSTVAFNKKIKNIGNNAFNQTKLKSVKLPN